MSDGAEFKNRKMASGRQFITIYDRADLSYTGRKGRQRKPLYVAGAVIPDPLKRADIRRDLLGVGFSFASLKAPPSETNNTTAEFRLDVLRGVLKKNGRSDLCPEEYLSWARNFYRPNVPAKFPIPYDHRLAEKFATLTDPVVSSSSTRWQCRIAPNKCLLLSRNTRQRWRSGSRPSSRRALRTS